MSTDAEKLKDLRNELRLTQAEFAKQLNTKQSRIAMVECGKNALSLELKIKISEVFNYDIDAESFKSYKPVYNSKSVPIPFYHVKAAANPSGGILILDFLEKDCLYFDVRYLKNVIGVEAHNCSLILAQGDSMDSGLDKNDDIKDGDLLLIDHSRNEIINNKIFIIEDLKTNELLVKKLVKDFYGKVYLISNNEKYPKREIKEDDNMKIIGRVMWNGSRDTF